MINVENIEVSGWMAATRGMRNPLNSWEKIDSYMGLIEDPSPINPNGEFGCIVGHNDLDLMHRLYTAGPEHRKYLRMITVTMDVTAPLYWWKEFDTYKVGTVCNSCSTMHKIHAKEFTEKDFSVEHLTPNAKYIFMNTVRMMNHYRIKYNESKDKKYWLQMIQLLPSSYNQRRTIQLNYETVVNIIHQRTNHKLGEWNSLVLIFKDLPYIKEIMEGADET